MDLILATIGLVILFIGGDLVVRGTVSISYYYNISQIFVSAILIGFGTSLPELIVALDAAWQGSTNLVIGNIIGSNIANVLLILGAAATIYPVQLKCSELKFEIIWVIGTFIVFTIIAVLFQKINFYAGILLLLLIFIYIISSFIRQKRTCIPEEQNVVFAKVYHPILSLILSILGFGAMFLGGDLFVKGAIALTHYLNISEEVVGLTVVALGTSLPEMVTVILSSIQGYNSIILGNIIGSSIFNTLGILGGTALVKDLPLSTKIIRVDLTLMIAIYLSLIALVRYKTTLNRGLGVFMLIIYATYFFYLYFIVS